MDVTPANQDLHPLIVNIAVGRDPDLERQLIEKSRQPDILKYTPNDAAQRFGDQTMFETWMAAGRELYWLLGKDNDLGGIIWYGQKAFPLALDLPETPSQTFAIRLYEGYSGHHLAVPAMRQTLEIHVRRAQARGENITGIWLETDVDNPAALKVYGRFGYQEVHRDAERVTMVLPATAINNLIKG